MLNGLMLTDKSVIENGKSDYNTALHSFLLMWVIMSSLLLDPSYVPLLAFNILLEKLVYFLFSNTDDLPQLDSSYLYQQMFYRLGAYITFAYSAFYQIGNTNSLSTVNVNACFVGLGSYMPIPCVIFMVVSIYSTYVYWFIAFFVRMQHDLMPANNHDDQNKDANHEATSSESSQADHDLNGTQIDDQTRQRANYLFARKNPIVLNYCTFYSIITWILIIRLLVMTLNMTVTFILRDHLFIWSVICPKLLYEIVFTILNLGIATLMCFIFTHDNCFLLH